MTNYPRSAYGSVNPNDGYPANGDWDAWGGYCYPQGVPSSLLGSTSYTSKATGGQLIKVTMRRELVPLWNLVFQIQDQKWGYPTWANRGGEAWGPWGYENRAISGSSRPSGHSAGLSVDENAPYNPYSYTFQSDMPPAMVADLESLGLYWGGRYEGQKYDPMHFGYCRTPADVPGHIAKAQAILGTNAGEDDEMDDATINQIATAAAKATVKELLGTAVQPFGDPAQPGKQLSPSIGNLLPMLGNWSAISADNTNDLTGK